MSRYSLLIQAFAGATAITTLAACEEVAPKKQPTVEVAKTVAAPIPAPAPARTSTPSPAPAPAPTAPPVVDDKPIAAKAVDVDALGEDAKIDDLLDGARAAIAAGELDRALRLAQIAVKKAPARSAAHNTLGRALLQKGQRKEAIASFEKAAELNPSSSWALNNLGLALIYDGRYEDAVDALEEATEMAFEQGQVEPYMWNNLGMAYEHLDRLEEARDAYRKAADGKHARARQNLARLEGVKSVLRTARAETKKDDVKGEAPTTDLDLPSVVAPPSAPIPAEETPVK
jgi:Flp pilus assembly protein TadD